MLHRSDKSEKMMFVRTLALLMLSNMVSVDSAIADGAPAGFEFLAENSYPRLGITVNRDMSIDKLQDGSPAQKARLLLDDRIVAIEGRSVKQLSARERVQMLVGQPGTICHISIQRGERNYTVAIRRVSPSPKAPLPKISVPSNDLKITRSNECGVTTAKKEQEVIQANSLDTDFVTILRQTENTSDIRQRVLYGLSFLPENTKRALRDQGVSIMITPSREELDGTKGGCCYQVRNTRVVIPEFNDRDNRPINKQRLPISILHELGHAYDHTNGVISNTAQFRALYDEESQKVPAENRKLLAYFLEDESSKETAMPVHQPTEECFASLFARRYYRGNDKLLDTLQASYPRAAAFVQSLHP
jgi:hypothetical protein